MLWSERLHPLHFCQYTLPVHLNVQVSSGYLAAAPDRPACLYAIRAGAMCWSTRAD